MDETVLYDRLAEHLDQGVVGSPKSPALMEILKILFPGVEAEVALAIPMQNLSLSQIKEKFPGREGIEEILELMAGRGTLFTSQKPGRERVYRLMPSVVGWAETPFWGGRDTPMARQLAPLWVKYRDEAFGRELGRGGLPVMRVLPVFRTLEDTRMAFPFDALKPMIEATNYRAVAKCPCRQIKTYVGQGCGHSLENCLHFGSMGRYMVEHDMAREITVEETLAILTAATQEGLVHLVDNIEGHVTTICNCCGCCCSFIDTKKRLGVHTVSVSNYVSRIDGEACLGCGVCVERCPMNALTLGEAGTAEVDEALCIGCGVCTPTCAAEAMDLVLRGEIKAPPSVEEVFTTRFKTN